MVTAFSSRYSDAVRTALTHFPRSQDRFARAVLSPDAGFTDAQRQRHTGLGYASSAQALLTQRQDRRSRLTPSVSSVMGDRYTVQVNRGTMGETTQLQVRGRNRRPFSLNFGYGFANAMAAVNRALHGKLGNRPNVGNPRSDRYLWGLNRLNVSSVWKKGITGRNVVVAVLDTGVDVTHHDLAQNIWNNPGEIPGNGWDDDGNGYVDDTNGWNFAYSNHWVTDYDGHGTHIAGTIAAAQNRYGVTGVAPNATIMPVKVLDDLGSGHTSDVANGIRYAVDNGADVISMSLGGGYSSEIAQAVRYAYRHNVVVVMSSGNEGATMPSYPAALADRWGIAVGAVDRNLQVANFSNRAGFRMDYVVAPGVNIYSTLPGNQFGALNGTSMAAPHVAGVVALMLSANPNLKPGQVEKILTDTANFSGVTA